MPAASSSPIAPAIGHLAALAGGAGDGSPRVLEVLAGVADPRGEGPAKWWLWVFIGPDTTCFVMDPTRAGKVLARHVGIDEETGQLAGDGGGPRRLVISSDGFDYFRGWLIVQGREVFEHTVADPDALADLPVIHARAPSAAHLECEDTLYIASKAHRAATGEELPARASTIRYPELDPA